LSEGYLESGKTVELKINMQHIEGERREGEKGEYLDMRCCHLLVLCAHKRMRSCAWITQCVILQMPFQHMPPPHTIKLAIDNYSSLLARVCGNKEEQREEGLDIFFFRFIIYCCIFIILTKNMPIHFFFFSSMYLFSWNY
jgi:hypothetical protein